MKFFVEFSSEQNKNLKNLAKRAGTTRIKVVQKALALFDVAVQQKEEGNQISVTKDDKILSEVEGIL